MSEDTFEKVVSVYRKLRDMKDARKKKHAEELKPLNEQLIELENWMLGKLNEVGANSVKTTEGTVYKSTHVKSRVTDWEAVLAEIQSKELWHMLERRVSVTAIEEYTEANGHPPAGIEVDSEVRVNVRRS